MNQWPIHFPLSISLYRKIESNRCNFSCCLNLLIKSSAFASTPWSSSPNDDVLSTLVVVGLLLSTISASSSSLDRPRRDFSLADLFIFAVSPLDFLLLGFCSVSLPVPGSVHCLFGSVSGRNFFSVSGLSDLWKDEKLMDLTRSKRDGALQSRGGSTSRCDS